MAKTKFDTRQEVTDKIISLLEEGVSPWIKPWAGSSGPVTPTRATGERYKGINTLLLWIAGEIRGFDSAQWMTFKQAQELGGQVRKGSKSERVIFYKTLDKPEDESSGEEARKIPMMRTYNVFNVAEIDGLPDRFYPKPVETFEIEPIEAAWNAARATGADIRRGGNQAYFAPGPDYIQLPDQTAFKSADGEAATLLHEIAHWTGAKSRLDREFGKRFGDRAYAAEELVAEITSAFLGAELGVSPAHIENHASYLDNWLQLLKDDKNAIFTAASQAQKAADYVMEALRASMEKEAA